MKFLKHLFFRKTDAEYNDETVQLLIQFEGIESVNDYTYSYAVNLTEKATRLIDNLNDKHVVIDNLLFKAINDERDRVKSAYEKYEKLSKISDQ